MRRMVSVLALGLLLTACGGDDDENDSGSGSAATTTSSAVSSSTTTAADDKAGAAEIAPEGGGLAFVAGASIEHAEFGDSFAEVEDSIRAVLGEAADARQELEECGGGADVSTRWDEIAIYGMGDEFVGWAIRDSSPLETADGVRPGTTRSELETAYADVEIEESSLGVEWRVQEEAGSLSGVLSAEAATGQVEDMWSGDACIAR